MMSQIQFTLSYMVVWGPHGDPMEEVRATILKLNPSEDCTWILERPEHKSIRITFSASSRGFGLLKRMAEVSGHMTNLCGKMSAVPRSCDGKPHTAGDGNG